MVLLFYQAYAIVNITTKEKQKMSVEPERSANQQSPSDKLDAYIATLENRTDFGVEDLSRRLTVKRSPNAEHREPWPDSGWSVVTTGVDKDGVLVGIVEKYLHPDDDAPARKRVALDEALEYDAEQRSRRRSTRAEMADRVFTVVGPDRPLAITPFNDESSYAMTRDEFNKQVGESSARPGLIEVPDENISGAQPNESADALTQPQEEVLSAQAELDRFKEELDAFEASLPEEDRVPAWQYSTARFENEKENAIRKMSAATRDNKAYLTYARLYKRYSDARSRAR